MSQIDEPPPGNESRAINCSRSAPPNSENSYFIKTHHVPRETVAVEIVFERFFWTCLGDDLKRVIKAKTQNLLTQGECRVPQELQHLSHDLQSVHPRTAQERGKVYNWVADRAIGRPKQTATDTA